MPFLTGYNRRKKITIDADTYITSDLSDFPLAVNITSGSDFWTNAPTSGTHVRFTSSDGTTELKFEVESYDTSGNDAWWHVKVPALSSSVDTEIYIYYDADTPSSGEDATNVWDASFQAVYHLTSDENDSTLNANNGTAQNGPARVTGAIDQALDFDGVDDLVDLGSTASYINDTVGTVSFWIKYPTGTSRATAYTYGGQDNTPSPGLFTIGTREHAAVGVGPRLDFTT